SPPITARSTGRAGLRTSALYAPALLWPAPIVGNRRDVLDTGDSQACGRHPVGATAVTSWIPAPSRPVAASERMAVSRPEPGPFTNTSTFCSPCSMPLRAAASAVTCAANGVDLRDPLNPAEPADSQTM